MGLLNTKKTSMQVHIVGGFKDAARYEAMQRRRKLFILLDIIAIICAIIGIFEIYIKNYKAGIILLLITVIIVAYFILRKKKRRFHRKHHKHKK